MRMVLSCAMCMMHKFYHQPLKHHISLSLVFCVGYNMWSKTFPKFSTQEPTVTTKEKLLNNFQL